MEEEHRYNHCPKMCYQYWANSPEFMTVVAMERFGIVLHCLPFFLFCLEQMQLGCIAISGAPMLQRVMITSNSTCITTPLTPLPILVAGIKGTMAA